MFPILKKSPWCTVLRLLLSLQPLLPPQVHPTQQQRQPIRFAHLYSFLSLILQFWIGALSFDRDWLCHRSTALLSPLKAPSTQSSNRARQCLTLFPHDCSHRSILRTFSALMFHTAALYGSILYWFITCGTEMLSELRNTCAHDSFLTLFEHTFQAWNVMFITRPLYWFFHLFISLLWFPVYTNVTIQVLAGWVLAKDGEGENDARHYRTGCHV